MMKINFFLIHLLLFTLFSMPGLKAQNLGKISVDLKKWHPISITFEGPAVSETEGYNPFLGYRLNVTFRHESGKETLVVPGFYARPDRKMDLHGFFPYGKQYCC